MKKHKSCDKCAIRDVLISQQQETIAALQAVVSALRQPLQSPFPPEFPYRGPSFAQPRNDPTANCPCRPENGGSGICGCTLGGPTIC